MARLKVSQATVDSINKMGMEKALAKARSGESGAEFEEAARRFYPKAMRESGPAVKSASTTMKLPVAASAKGKLPGMVKSSATRTLALGKAIVKKGRGTKAQGGGYA